MSEDNFIVGQIRNSFGNEVIVNSKWFSTLGATGFVALCTQNGTQIPTRLRFDDNVSCELMSPTITVASSLQLAEGAVVTVKLLDDVRPAKSVRICIKIDNPGVSSGLFSISEHALIEMGRVCVRHQVFSNSVSFCLSPVISVVATLNSTNENNNNFYYLIDDMTEVDLKLPLVNHSVVSDHSNDDGFKFKIFNDFYGSKREIDVLFDMIDQYTSNVRIHPAHRHKSSAIIIGRSGHGKTFLLRKLCCCFDSLFYDMGNLAEFHRGDGEAMFDEIKKSVQPRVRLLLLDNIQNAVNISDKAISAPLMSASSAFRKLLEDVSKLVPPRCFVVCSANFLYCNEDDLYGNNSKFSRSFPFSTVLNIQPLTHNERKSAFIHVVTTRSYRVRCDMSSLGDAPNSSFELDNLAAEISSRTSGYYFMDLLALMKQSINGDNVLAESELFKAVDIVTPMRMQYGSIPLSSVLPDVSRAQELPGYEYIVNELVEGVMGHVHTSQDPKFKLMSHFGIKPVSGILISGPSGIGKTALAMLLGKRLQTQFKFLSVSCADLVHKVVGDAESKITTLFRLARSLAPSFLLLDDIDIILGSPEDAESADNLGTYFARDNATNESSTSIPRSKSRSSNLTFDRMLSTFLLEIDGLNSSGQPNSKVGAVVVIATATNSRSLDRALLRPGRLEHHVTLGIPNMQTRLCIIKKALQLESTTDEGCVGIAEFISEFTSEMTPSQIKGLISSCACDALKEHLQNRKEVHQNINEKESNLNEVALSKLRNYFKEIVFGNKIGKA